MTVTDRVVAGTVTVPVALSTHAVGGAQGMQSRCAEGDLALAGAGEPGYWNGTTDKGVCVIEMWESQEAHQSWFDANIRPILPPGADAGFRYVQLLNQVQPS